MSANCNNNNGCECTGKGAIILPHKRLSFILRTDPLLGSSDPNIPDGVFNRELAKLQENSCSIANHFISYLNRSTVVFGGSAPSVGSEVGTPPGSPSNPTSLSYHTVEYAQTEVDYSYNIDLGKWYELARRPKQSSSVTVFRKTVVVDLENGERSGVFPLPTTTDSNENFNWALSDIKLMYVESPVGEPAVGVSHALTLTGSQVTAHLDDVLSDDSYELYVIFEKIETN